MRKKAFTAAVIASAALYIFVLYNMLFLGFGRENIMLSGDMQFNYAANLIPFKTIGEYIAAFAYGSRGNAIRNLVGNLFLLFPLGFYLPFFLPKTAKAKTFAVVATLIIFVIEFSQLVTMSGSFDIDDFILNLAGALLGFAVCKHTPVRALFSLRAY